MKKIYLAGGCFWGVEAYFNQLKGVIATRVGYIDGNKSNPTYEEVCHGVATHAEAVYIEYDAKILSLEALLEHFLRIVDPFSVNRQGHDVGPQYRSGIYFVDPKDQEAVDAYFKTYFKDQYEQVKIHVKPATDYWDAENYHQEYLKKNPSGYCHIDLGLAKEWEVK